MMVNQNALPTVVIGIATKSPCPKLEECTIIAFVDSPIRSQKPTRGIPDQNTVLTRPMNEDIQPPTNEPMMCPNKNAVAEVKTFQDITVNRGFLLSQTYEPTMPPPKAC